MDDEVVVTEADFSVLTADDMRFFDFVAQMCAWDSPDPTATDACALWREEEDVD